MGSLCHQKRLQNPIHFKASSFPNSNILPSIKHLGSGRRVPVATSQRGSGTYKTGSTGVLLSDFSGPEEKREIKTHNRFVQTVDVQGFKMETQVKVRQAIQTNDWSKRFP